MMPRPERLGSLVVLVGLLLLWGCGGGGGGGSTVAGVSTPDAGSGGGGSEACSNFQQSGSEGTPSATASIDPFNSNHTKQLSVSTAWAQTTWGVTDGQKISWKVVETGGGTVTSPGLSVTYTAPLVFPPSITGQTCCTVQATLTSQTGSVCKTVRITLNN